jgi:hypothetical protein
MMIKPSILFTGKYYVALNFEHVLSVVISTVGLFVLGD